MNFHLELLHAMSKTGEIKAQIEEARQLVESADYSKALKLLVSAYEFPEVIDSNKSSIFILLKKLVPVYEPAKSAVLMLRDFEASKILKSDCDYVTVSNFGRLNEILGDENGALNLFDRLIDPIVKDLLLSHVWKDLVRSQRYEEVKPYLESLVGSIFIDAYSYDGVKLFPNDPGSDYVRFDRLEERGHLRNLAEEGPYTFEIALKLDMPEMARRIAEIVLERSGSAELYCEFLKVAIKCGANEIALMIFEKGDSKLSGDPVWCGQSFDQLSESLRED